MSKLQGLLFGLATLVLVSLAPVAAGLAGGAYLLGASLLGAGFVAAALRMAVARNVPAARALFLSSILYLVGLCALLLLDRR